MILAGGEGKRLGPLTLDRAKPAVPFGGRYRIIDIVLSNFVNSGSRAIKVLTQYKSASLEEHIARGWRLSPMLDHFIEAIPAQQRTGQDLVQGLGRRRLPVPARHHRREARASSASSAATTSTRWTCARCSTRTSRSDADVTVAAIPVPREGGARLRRPRDRRRRAHHRLPREGRRTRRRCPGTPDMCLASMGNYIFKTDDAHATSSSATPPIETSKHDFGHDILPRMVARRAGTSSSTTSPRTSSPARSERERGYWRDIGTIEAYWDAQMDLVAIHPLFNLYNERWPIRTGVTHDPPAKFVFRDEAHARVGIATDCWSATAASSPAAASIAACSRVGCASTRSARSRSASSSRACASAATPSIRRCIIDKDVEIPPGIEIGFDLEADRRRFFVTESGIVVIPKRAKLGHPGNGG